jgi:serpin B
MRGEVAGGYADTPELTAAELPYQGGEISMVVVLPKAGTLEAFEAGSTAPGCRPSPPALSPESLSVELPKFTFESKASLKDALTSLGWASPSATAPTSRASTSPASCSSAT